MDKEPLRMKSLSLVALVLLLSTFLIPAALAAPGQVGGLTSIVRATGTTQSIEFKFPLDPNDPDQDVGSYQYNLTVDATGPVDLGNVTNMADVTAGGGFITFTWKPMGGTATYAATIHSWDGATEGTKSCTVTINTAVKGDYDACGDMVLIYEQAHCFNDDADDSFGFTETYRVKATTDKIIFRAAGEESAWAGVNLGGDTAELQYNFTITAGSEGGTTKALMFFSTVDVDVSSVSVGNAADAVDAFTTPNTGSFRNGYGVILKEDGSDYTVRVFKNTNGATQVFHEETWTDGVFVNTGTAGRVLISPYSNNFTLELGNERTSVSLTDAGIPADFHSFWIAEYGTGFFGFVTHDHAANDAKGCLYTIPAELGGGTNQIGALSGGQPIEDFGGEGGFEGDPEFPGMDVETLAAQWEMDERAFGYILASVLFMAGLIAGWLSARAIGAGIGGVSTILLGFTLNLVPGWFIITLLAAAAGFITLTFKAQGGNA